MNRAPVILFVVSALLLLGAAISFGVGAGQVYRFDVEEEAIFVGEQGTVKVEEFSSYSVYVNSDYSCSETTVSIYDEEWEYFWEDCDPVMNERGWNMIGHFSHDACTEPNPSLRCQLNVDANHEIAIINDMVFLSEGFGSVLLSVGLCCLGIICVIVGIIVLATSKPNEAHIQRVNEAQTPPVVEKTDHIQEQPEWWGDEK